MFFKFICVCIACFALIILFTENKFLAFLDKTWLASYMPFRKLSVPFDDTNEETATEEQNEAPMPSKEEKQEGYGTPTDTFTTIGVEEKMDNHKSFAWDINAPKPEKKKK